MSKQILRKRIQKRNGIFLSETSSWITVAVIIFSSFSFLLIQPASATTAGTMKLYLHEERSDANKSYNMLSFTPPEPSADVSTGTLSTTNVNATPATSFCNASQLNNGDFYNQPGANATATANRCMATFISAPVGQAITMSTSDAASITGQFWSSESATNLTMAMQIYIYRWSGSGTTVNATDRLATLACADPGTSATSCAPTAVSPANNVTFSASDRIVAIASLNVTTGRNGGTGSIYFDSTARTASFIKLSYTALGYNSANKPSLAGSMDDDFSTDSTTTSCTTGGITYHTKWTCLDGSAANTTGAINAGGTSGTINGDSSNWLWLQNQTTATSATVSNFGSTPSNTFLYQSLPNAYGDGSVTTVINSTALYQLGATPTTSSSPYTHSGLVLWASDTDYLEIQLYSDGANSSGGTANVVHVALNNSGTLSGAQNLDSAITGNDYTNVWVRFVNTGGSYQAQYSLDGASFTNVGSPVTHAIFSRAGLNAFVAIANPVSSYAAAFEWFQSTLGSVTYNQTSYEFFANADSVTPGASLAAQNTPITLTSAGQKFRLRQLIKANGQASVGAIAYYLQSADLSTYGSCSAIPSGNWSRVYQTTTTSSVIAGTGANRTGIGTVAWSSPANITAEDGTSATATIPAGGATNYIDATNFGFSVPSSAVIANIQADFKILSASASVFDNAALLDNSGTLAGLDQSQSNAWSSSGSLWWQTHIWSQPGLTAAQVNAAGFGAVLSAKNTGGTSASAQVDAARMSITYYNPTTIGYYDNPTPGSSQFITYQSGTDPTESGQTVVPETYLESDVFNNQQNAFGATVDAEWDFSLYDAGAPAGTTYCLRAVDFNGNPLSTYTNYPMVTTFSSGGSPTTDQLLRGGEWFNSGSKQPFFWAN